MRILWPAKCRVVVKLDTGTVLKCLKLSKILLLTIFPQNQVRDEYRTDFDGGRGGYGMIVKQKLEIPETFG